MDSEDPSSASCRIVVVSSSVETAREVAHRIKTISGDNQPSSPSSEVIHWTIKNKYYTAPVHFHPIHLEGLSSIELDEVPAIIYTWKENEPYKEHMKFVCEQTSTFKPEVSLAVNMAPTTEDELEDFFFEHGFEYVSGQSESREQSPGLSSSSSTPGINRALDALSTIMWPSMVRTETAKPKFSAKLTLPRDGMDNIDAHLLSILNDSGGKSNKQHQMELLERWLEQDDSSGLYSRNLRDDDYASLYSHAHSVSTVKSDDPWATGGISLSDTLDNDTVGFDDDFTDFVSAPAVEAALEDNSNSNENPEFPTQAEIQATSARIFGPQLTVHPISGPFYALSDSPIDLLEHGNNQELQEIDAPSFDLTRILGALEGMKEEISQITDEQERRKAAAKVALGLVYGLEGVDDEADIRAGQV